MLAYVTHRAGLFTILKPHHSITEKQTSGTGEKSETGATSEMDEGSRFEVSGTSNPRTWNPELQTSVHA
jgi:hypothetical protein